MPATTKGSLAERLAALPFQGYAYAYPHKTAYRPLDPAPSLRELWAGEDLRQLFLYLHVPFCEMRCGFCNLFTTSLPDGGLVRRWLGAMHRQADVLAEALGPAARFARGAIGGGTPTFLEAEELDELLGGMRARFGDGLAATSFSVEMSPATVSAEKLSALRQYGMQRASIGIQSFTEAELQTAGRAQRIADVDRALNLMALSGVPVRNIDLIYGIPGQTTASWKESLARAATYRPEEIYLYPLYVRPLTGMDRLGREPGDERDLLYRTGRDWLLEHGYRQVSMRLFRAVHLPPATDPAYVCQEDGMVGLGPGARSYTRAVHYSSDYAVARASVLQIVERFVKEDAAVRHARYGIRLEVPEQQRRYLIKSLLRIEGLELQGYRERFGTDCLTDWPMLGELFEHGLAILEAGWIRPTAAGLEWSDTIGPWLYSTEMAQRMEDFAWS